MSTEADWNVVVQGRQRTIEYAVCLNGSTPARDFVENLDESDQRKLATLFRRMADEGRIFNEQHFKRMAGKIFEFKRFQVRVGCFQIGNRWLLTHGFIKKTDKWPRSELERAERIMGEHVERESRGRR